MNDIQGYGCEQQCGARTSASGFRSFSWFLVSRSFISQSFITIILFRFINLYFPCNNNSFGNVNRKAWIVGMLMAVILPFWKNKWGPLLKFKSN